MKLVDSANGLYLNLGTPSNVSIPAICAYYRNTVGELNATLGTNFRVDSTTLELTDSGVEIGEKEMAIFNLLYEIKYYTRESRNFMGVGGVDQLLSAESDNGKLTFVNRNTSAASYIQLRKESKLALDELVNYYKLAACSPSSVEGDDTSVNTTSDRMANNIMIGQTSDFGR
jgi:hypothetical protein